MTNLKKQTCVCCDQPADIKDYRTRYDITDGYPACWDCYSLTDEEFWKKADKNAEKLIQQERKNKEVGK